MSAINNNTDTKKIKRADLLNRRKALIVEDNELNREILAALLEEEFDVLTAENGEIGYQILAENYHELSIIMLDVYMPVCNGFEFLERVKNDMLLSSVPVIVTTGSDKIEDEEKCLDLGASDFVTKPYNPKVVLGRIRSIIKLKESVATLSAVEYDDLTGLYTIQAFYHHVERMLKSDNSPDLGMLVADLKEFKFVNSVFGEKKGNEVLTYLGKLYSSYIPGGIGARQGDKFFFVFPIETFPNEEEWQKIMEMAENSAPVPNLIIKYGIDFHLEKTKDSSILCDRVLIAASSIKYDYSKFVAIYDEKISEQKMKEQKMEADFDDAISHEEFKIWFQPKVDIHSETVIEAEALVRWFDKSGNMVSPGAFIPLFEKDGLIAKLDEYVFRKVCQFQKERLELGKKVVPVSVNLSRNSIFYKGMVDVYAEIMKETGIPSNLVPIELTESASVEGARILELTQSLVEAGFSLQMDDFGSGYSSLSGLSVLPFDVLKLDKSLVDQIGNKRGNIILKNTIKIAQELGMKVVAEGVEEHEQVEFLRKYGCDMIQGYYYSPPKKQEIFEEILENGLELPQK